MMPNTLPVLLLAMFFLLAVQQVYAQGDAGLAVIKQWLIEEIAKDVVGTKKPVQNQSVSLDRGSTTFVDQTSGPDLVSGALNLTPLGGTPQERANSGSMTASLYALAALGSGSDPLRPTFYHSHEGLRKAFFTIGREELEQGSLNAPGTVYGIKFLPWNRRDAASIAKDPQARQALTSAARSLAGVVAAETAELGSILFAANAEGRREVAYLLSLTSTEIVQQEIDKLTQENQEKVTQIARRFAQRYGAASQGLTELVNALRRRLQFSIAYQTTQRNPGLRDDHRLEVILDRGYMTSLFVTFNASYDYSNSSFLGGDIRSGRGALDLRWNVISPELTSLRDPLQIALSGEGMRRGEFWQYRTQLQITLPIAPGVMFPLSFGYGNRPDLLLSQQRDVYGKFGLTFDIQKLGRALRQRPQ